MNLINGEKIEVEVFDNKSIQLSDNEINKKYIDGEIRIVTEQARYPLNSILGMVSSDNYKIDPEYQRRHRWSNEKRSRLIESLIMNVPLPPIFLYEYEYSNYEVMDGLQRLTAIASFYDDVFQLEGLTKWPELNGKKYSQLPSQVRKGIDRRYISSIILLHETASTEEEANNLKQMVFDRINSGGEKLTPQEKRNANFNGNMNRLCIKLSENDYLCKMWGIPLANKDDGSEISSARREDNLFKTMFDVELVLRFFAYRQRNELQKRSLEDYLDFYLEKGNYFPSDTLKSLGALFEATVELVYEIFGPDAFHMLRQRKTEKGISWGWYDRPTTAIYDPMMFVLSHFIDNKDKLITNKSAINHGLEKFYIENYDVFEGRNTNPSALQARNSKFMDFIEGYSK
ncbi:DUF262 domain-containing protein [Cronobacter sakazakii]|uniref:DUF262 domain-containing protein n=1 Tax=Cronobacter sakazakii TaxID=28141 RepID=UPI0028959388|nr:DUF262 domain-containing protein [Cronobacter sakazakii]ELY3538471.1 DUF262 domain-containing protein [Cronobacter sakazakii]MDT3542276.1 DUF262 domain-containing protein [Cronobacter sakazakii]MDT3628611.1 DUF262 domain-containing protein [Cronobacter sakazakii]